MILILLYLMALGWLGFFYWRHIWFFRNPSKKPPVEDGILSPADGRVVYVKEVNPDEAVISIKKGLQATVKDIVREDISKKKLLIGIFMSPFDVHYNRAPLSGAVQFVHHYPGINKNHHMGFMHLRLILKKRPFYRNSLHIVQNERTVTKINSVYQGRPLSCYVVQIAAKNVNGIESYVKPGKEIERGDIFGMIRIGSQVDLVVTRQKGMEIRIQPGDRVYAGETILIR